MKKYQLLKDLPLIKAGTEFTLAEGDACLFNCDKSSPRENLSLALFGDEFDEWFEEIDGPEVWKPKENDWYFYIDGDGEANDNVWLENCEIDEQRYTIGNCFKTEEEAERTIEKLKALKRLRDHGLKLCDSRLEEEGIQGDKWHITIKATIKPFSVSDENFIKNFDLLFKEEK